MRTPTLTFAALSLLALHAAVWAGPVPAAESDASATAATLPHLPARAIGEVEAADGAASAPSGSTLAAELLKEADAGAAGAEGPRQPRREDPRGAGPAAAAKPTPQARATANDDAWGLRDAGKAAVQWVKDTIPWLRSDDDAQDAGQAPPLKAAEWSSSPLDGGNERGARQAAQRLPDGSAAGADPLTTVGYGDAARQKAADPDQNLLRAVIDVLRQVLEHPMTWLVVALFVVGGIVVKKIDRRPTK